MACPTLSHYTGGIHGWGTMVSECALCGEVVSEYTCDEDGFPMDAIFDDEETHRCPSEEE